MLLGSVGNLLRSLPVLGLDRHSVGPRRLTGRFDSFRHPRIS
jgi:hypothetical protein